MPLVQQQAPLDLQGFPQRSGWPTLLSQGRNIPQQMCPANLAPPSGIPGVCTPTLRDQPPLTALPQAFVGHLAAMRQPPHKDR